jgi:hypothetical protein
MKRILFAVVCVLSLGAVLRAQDDLDGRPYTSKRWSSYEISLGPTLKDLWLNDLSTRETFRAANLSAAEQKEIIDQVEKTSFDIPDSWQTELRVRRISLGESDGLLIRGTQLLCGGTGNCETWVFRRSAGKWLNMFDQEAPIVSGFGFEQEASAGIKNFLVKTNISADKESRILFKFDGNVYRQSECFDVSVNGGAADKVETVPCK